MPQQTSMLSFQQVEGTMLSQDKLIKLSITGGQGGPGGQGCSEGATGGHGADGFGPTLNITAQQLNLSTLASEQASQQDKIRAAQIGIKCPLPSRKFQGRQHILNKMHDFFTANPATQKIYLLHELGGAGKTQIALPFIKDSPFRWCQSPTRAGVGGRGQSRRPHNKTAYQWSMISTIDGEKDVQTHPGGSAFSSEGRVAGRRVVGSGRPAGGGRRAISGIRSLAATHEQLIIGWTGDINVSSPAQIPSTPTSDPAATESPTDKGRTVPSSTVSPALHASLRTTLQSYQPKESDPDNDWKTEHFTSTCIRVCGYEATPHGIDAEGHIMAVMHCHVAWTRRGWEGICHLPLDDRLAQTRAADQRARHKHQQRVWESGFCTGASLVSRAFLVSWTFCFGLCILCGDGALPRDADGVRDRHDGMGWVEAGGNDESRTCRALCGGGASKSVKATQSGQGVVITDRLNALCLSNPSLTELSSFSDIFFIDTSTITTIETGLKNIAVLNHFGTSQQDGLLWLTNNIKEWLLVLDNADDPNINLQDFIPECEHGNIIITSRNPRLCVYAGSDSLVSDMEEADAMALLLKTAGQKATAHKEQIAAEIVKAGAFISKSRNLGNYLQLYATNQARLLSEKPVQSQEHYKQPVYTTWQMSFDRLSPLAAMLLQHCSFLHFNGISEAIFSYVANYPFYSSGPSKGELSEIVQFLSHFRGPAGKWDSLQFAFTMNEVKSYSLISFDEETNLFSVHPLVHVWCQEKTSSPEKCMLTTGTHLALPFRYYYGLLFHEAGKYKHAVRMLETVLEEYKQILGDNHPDTISAMSDLGLTCWQLGDYQNAKDLGVTVLEKRKHILDEDHPDTITAMGNLGGTYHHLGDYQDAKGLEVFVLEKRKQILGEDHPGTILTMGNLGNTYWHLGDYQNAKDLQVIVLEKRKQILGEDHPDTIWAIGNLATTYWHLKEYRKAEELEVIVLKRKQILGDTHPDTLPARHNLYSNLGDHQKAQELENSVEEQKYTLESHL
ncbi:hypothetical protein DFH08DRAFT_822090 [Mycena albidolilacea]|uniref:Kinesin light chain n=1 Tax=Mycena albidolilacea TaxID=1033008 RepID=A0AAD6ZA87_9AGAR|nr:hypothetical protein DFH08DRAFT_822090 [Mycena albidolilacea]